MEHMIGEKEKVGNYQLVRVVTVTIITCHNSTDHNPLNHISQGIRRYDQEPHLEEKCLSGFLFGGCSTQFDGKNPIASGSQESSRKPITFCRLQY